MKPSDTRLLAISQGDPAGIGPEIIIKALASGPAIAARCVIHGDPALFESIASGLNLPVPVRFDVSGHTHKTSIKTGNPSAESGESAYRAIVSATKAVLDGDASAIITAPISKHAMNLAGHAYPGHTELLAELAGGCEVRMMLANPELRVVLVTVHQPLAQAVASLTSGLIAQTLRITASSLGRWLGRPPQIAVAGVNPHAGEGGLLGSEEHEIIVPAIESAQAEGIAAFGPFPPDTVFMQARGLKRFDAVVAMYHDQGLIPVKYLGVEHGVNVTLGLPFTRTSPDHGTAFDIAGTGQADPSSLLAAIRMADQLHEAHTSL